MFPRHDGVATMLESLALSLNFCKINKSITISLILMQAQANFLLFSVRLIE